ncbi:MAG: FAD-dependent oxidoreductase [Candidatus Zipacnadales bacterium]
MTPETAVQEAEMCATCMAACPVLTDTRGYVEAVAEGDYERALDILLASNPFPSVCGRICHHPCEQACRRVDIDSPVSLRALKRFVVEQTVEYRQRRQPLVKPPRGKKVAIIGSGPAGLTAANDLALEGFEIHVFEREDRAGGMLAHTIPRYRLPATVLQQDIDDILKLGVQLHLNMQIGVDKTLEDLKAEGFEAVLIATGLSESQTLAVDGIESNGVHLAMDFLRNAAAGCPPNLGERVIVIGGGNVAFDVARTAIRLGARYVTIACLESREEMPAWEWEIQEGIEEGIALMPGWGPKAIYAEEGKVRGIELKRCTRVFDDQKRFNPEYDDTCVAIRPADSIILAIGQRADLRCLEGSPVEKDERGRLVYSPTTLATSVKGIFVAGEVATGPGSAIEAVREGHRAARAVTHYLTTGEMLEQVPPAIPTPGELAAQIAERVRKYPRQDPHLLPPTERITGFQELERGLTEAEALQEARRCLGCLTGAFVREEVCAGCLTCVRICPYDIPTVHQTAVIVREQCQACGLCAAECPAAGISLTRFSTDQMEQQTRALLQTRTAGEVKRPFIVSYCCLYETTSRKYLRSTLEEAAKTGILRIMVPCTSRLRVIDLLRPLELGADGVVILSCAAGECIVPTAEEKLAAHVRQARRLLENVGVDPNRILHFETVGSAEESWESFWNQSIETLSARESAASAEVNL